MPFTAEELEDMRRFDKEIEEDFATTPEERTQAHELDIEAKTSNTAELTKPQKYYYANREKENAKSRAYYAIHYERIRARQNAYNLDHREEKEAYDKVYRQENKELIQAQQKRYKAKNREQYAEAQSIIKPARKAKKISQRKLAQLLGVSRCTIQSWESGALKAKWELLYTILPELEGMR